jgi:hypothetical protein
MEVMGKKRCLFLLHFALLLFIFPHTFSGSREADTIHSYGLQKSTISQNITTKKFTITGRGGFRPLSFVTKKFTFTGRGSFRPLSFVTKKFTITGNGGFTPLNIKTKTFTITGKGGSKPLAFTTKKMVDDERLK